MAEYVPWGWCVKLEFVNGLESITTEYQYNNQPCAPGYWAAFPSDQMAALVTSYREALARSPATTFYADSTELFGLFLAGIVGIYCAKLIVNRLIFAS